MHRWNVSPLLFFFSFRSLIRTLKLRFEGTPARKSPNLFGFSLAYLYLCRQNTEEYDEKNVSYVQNTKDGEWEEENSEIANWELNDVFAICDTVWQMNFWQTKPVFQKILNWELKLLKNTDVLIS